MELTKEFINTLAPNPAAIKNGESLANGNKFVALNISKDDTLLFGECKGSGKSNYFVSVDFINGEIPTSRCNCPSRQFPCKHGLGLMYAYVNGKTFDIEDVPETISVKREKQEKAIEKKELKKDELKTNKEPAKMTKAKMNTLIKKVQSQLEGVNLAEKILYSIINTGYASIDAKTKMSYIEQIKNLGNYYINGIQTELNAIFTNLDTVKDSDYTTVVNQTNFVYALLVKSKEYLNMKKEDPEKNLDIDSNIEEQIGYAWKLEELIQKGKYKQSKKLVQIGFYSYEDVALKAFVDEGYYTIIGEPDVYITKNFRPFKAVKYIKQDDSIFSLLNVNELVIYPGKYNQRIRFDSFSLEELTNENICDVLNSAKGDFSEIIKTVKNFIKTPLADKNPLFLIKPKKIYKNNINQYILEDDKNNKITLSDISYFENSHVEIFEKVCNSLGDDFSVLVMFENNLDSGLIVAYPISIITQNKIIKLLY